MWTILWTVLMMLTVLMMWMVFMVWTDCMYCILPAGGEVFSWGTNSMGQCGQGHSNSSVTKPGKVHGLDRVQVQQISAGTSHSIVWTAMPVGR